VSHLILFNRKERKEFTQRTQRNSATFGNFAVKNKREVNIYFLLIETNKSIFLQNEII